MDSNPENRSPLIRYGAAAACVTVALLLRLALNRLIGHRNPFATCFLAVLIVARFWGLGPGLFVAVAGGVGSSWLTMPAGRPFAASLDGVGLGVYFFACCFAIWMIELLHRAHRAAETNARLADQRLSELRGQSDERNRQQKVSALLTAIVESSDDAIISKNLDGTIQSWNGGAQQIFGYTADEAIGKAITILTPPERIQEEAEIIERIRHGGGLKHFETVRRRKDGKQIHVSLTISPILDAAGTIVGASQIARDITEQQELESQLRQTQKLESLGVLAGGPGARFQ